jgi:hypothetical protein
MEQNRYVARGGHWDYEDLRRKRVSVYESVKQSKTLQQDCEFLVGTIEEIIGAEDTDTTKRLEVEALQFEGEHGLIVRKIRRSPREHQGGHMYVVSREVYDRSNASEPQLVFTRSFGLTTTRVSSAGGAPELVYAVNKYEWPTSTAFQPWLNGTSLGAGHHDLLDFDFDELLDELDMVSRQLHGGMDFHEES